MDTATLYRTIWRWHFYAGLFVMPMVVILALTGAIYLFKPQVDAWEERAWRGLPASGTVFADAQVKAALAAFPGSRLHSYRLPEAENDAALIHLALPGRAMRDVFVSPDGKLVGSLDPEWRIMQVVHDIHGQLLIGRQGSWIVELAASWAIVMILTGLYLWWPKGRGAAGVIWPRLGGGGRVFWRDLHAVTGFWVSGLALVLLVTGLPWADVWGSAFKAVRTEIGWVKGQQDWTIGGAPAAGSNEHAEHDHGAMAAMGAMSGAMPSGMHRMPDGTLMAGPAMSAVSLSEIVVEAKSRHLPFPVIVTPPGGPQPFGGKAKQAWSVRSDTQNRPLRVSLTFDPATGRETSREVFADKHVIDRVIGYGVAWHEGQLFGIANQLIGVATALMLTTMAVSGFILWRRRKPADGLGAPPLPALPPRIGSAVFIILALAALLPLLAISMAAMLLIETAVLRRLPRAAWWLGLRSPPSRARRSE